MAWITFGAAPPARAASSHLSGRLGAPRPASPGGPRPARRRSAGAYPEKELFAASRHVSSVSDAMRPAGRVDAATPQARPGAHRTWGTAIRPVSRQCGLAHGMGATGANRPEASNEAYPPKE